jgi:hypothetical protein
MIVLDGADGDYPQITRITQIPVRGATYSSLGKLKSA